MTDIRIPIPEHMHADEVDELRKRIEQAVSYRDDLVVRLVFPKPQRPYRGSW
jgi:hypothetical protein